MPFPLSILTDEVSQDLGRCAEFLADHAIDTVEIRTVGGARVPDIDPRAAAAIGRWVEDDGIEVLGVSPGTFKGDVADLSRLEREQDEVLPRAIELAVAWRAPYVVTFGFDNPTGAPPPAHALDALGDAATQCAAAGVTLLLENEPGFLAGTAAETRAVLDLVGHLNLACNWDPCNSNEYATADLERALNLLGNRVRHVHVKNGKLTAGARFPRYGALADGDIDWLAHLRQLRGVGYRGHLGIETHFEPLTAGSSTLVAELHAMFAELEEWS